MEGSSRNTEEVRVASELFEQGRYEEAFQRYHTLAEAGSINAQLLVGWMYHAGRGVKEDLAKARMWYEKAADTGSSEGQFYLGTLYRAEQKYQQAIEYLEKSASQDYVPALYLLGIMYELGQGVSADKNKAHKFYHRAAKMGHLFAQREIAVNMIKGKLGVMQIPKGLFILAKIIFTVFRLGRTDPDSDSIRIPEDWRYGIK